MKCGTFAFWTTFEMTSRHVLSLLTLWRHTHTHTINVYIYTLNLRTSMTITKNQISVDSAIISQDPGCHLWGRKWITMKDAMFLFKCFQSQTGTKLHFVNLHVLLLVERCLRPNQFMSHVKISPSCKPSEVGWSTAWGHTGNWSSRSRPWRWTCVNYIQKQKVRICVYIVYGHDISIWIYLFFQCAYTWCI